MKIPLYYLWTDTMFYVYCAAFVMSLLSLIYSIRGYLELANAAPYADDLADNTGILAAAETEALAPSEELPGESADSEKTMVVSNIEELISESIQDAQAEGQAAEVGAQAENTAPDTAAQAEFPEPQQAAEPEPAQPSARNEQAAPVQEPAAHEKSRAEEFVKGIYEHISRIDSRLDAIETSVANKNVDGDFAKRFLEDMMVDFESLDREKIKARIEFLITDLKK